MDGLRQVLVVGGASDTETVLKAVLEPRGMSVERSRGGVRRAHSPEIVVIDLDVESDPAVAASRWMASHRILIGSETPDSIADRERFLAKPFQFPELVQVIEELLETPAAA